MKVVNDITPPHPLTAMSPVCAYNASYTGQLVQGLFDAHYTQPPYAAFYPDIVSTLQVSSPPQLVPRT